MKKYKNILSFWVRHENEKIKFVDFDWDKIWILVKYKIFKRKKNKI
jgi:hypothetical protein